MNYVLLFPIFVALDNILYFIAFLRCSCLFMENMNRPACKLASVGIGYVFANVKAPPSKILLIYCFTYLPLAVHVYRGSDLCKDSDESFAFPLFVT